MGTFPGTADDDRITGTSDADQMFGEGGDDRFTGAGGEDEIFTGAGDDTAFGGAGDDLLDDFTESSSGGNDTLFGGDGNDRAFGYTGLDQLFGEAGDDTLDGGDGADTLDGGDGNDVLTGGADADVLSGGAGDDIYRGVEVDLDEILEEADGGTDTVVVDSGWTLVAGLENLRLTDAAGAAGATGNDAANKLIGNIEDNFLYGLAGDDTLRGDDGDDQLYGDAGTDTMSGGNGDDLYFVDVSSDLVKERFSGSSGGIDTVFSSATLVLGENVERLSLLAEAGPLDGTGNALGNRLAGNESDNILRGLDGADRIQSGRGADILIGGLGNDVFDYAATPVSSAQSRDTLRAGDDAEAFEGAGDDLGDRFDFTEIDADETTDGTQDFAFGTSEGKGRLWAEDSGDLTLIRGNIDDDAAAELEIAIEDGSVLASAYDVEDFLV